jgi:hypothetical protein
MKTIDQNPTVADQILFSFKITDENNYLIDPYKVESIKIYFVERDFSSSEQKEYSYDINQNVYNVSISGNLTQGSRFFTCISADSSNIQVGMSVLGDGIRDGTTVSYINDDNTIMLSSPASSTLANSVITFASKGDVYTYNDSFYYKTTNCVKVIGNSDFPAWLSTDTSNALISKSSGVGGFEYLWDSSGMREGDYFICWSWIPKVGQDLFSNNIKFNLKSSNFLSTSSPAHHTKPDKYETLLERYLPEMYKMRMSDNDRSPDVLQKLNQSVAAGFTLIEDIGNQVVDLLDANGVSEYIITYLGNTLDLRLKSQDPTLWRRQIKEAIPLYKKKGTLGSVKDSLSQAGMKYLGIQNYWQITSPYFYQDSFFYNEEDASASVNQFTLTKKAIGVDSSKFKIYLTKYNSIETIELLLSDFSVSDDEYGKTIVSVGEEINLDVGDTIRFSYYYSLPSNSTENDLDEYIKNLPLSDSRNEKELVDGSSVLTLPLKNWNVRLISENDPMINLVISTRHPFVKNLVFGKIRTEFPYSENVYNMDQYNGSTRDSNNPCDIDKDFIDPCSYCRSSSFDIDVEVEKLSDDSVEEIKNILSENIPFHSYLRNINMYGGQNEFVVPPVEDYDVIISYRASEDVISGAAQQWFYRNKLEKERKLRSDMAEFETVYTGNLTFKNEKTVLFSEDVDLRNTIISDDCFLEITSGLNAGVYNISKDSSNSNYLVVSGVLEPLSSGIFNFKLYNKLFETTTTISRDDYLDLFDSSVDFIKDDQNINLNNNFKIKINFSGTDYILDVKEILPSNKLLLNNNDNIIIKNLINKPYSILNESLEVVWSGSANFSHSYRSLVNIDNHEVLLKNDNNYLFFSIDSNDFLCKIISQPENGTVYIDTYNGDNTGSVGAEFRQMITMSSNGYFSYLGLKAESTTNLEELFEIVNGANGGSTPATLSDAFKEDFAILLKSYDDPYIELDLDNNYYFISEIDGSTIWLSGLFESFGVESGTELEVEILKFNKPEVEIQESYLNCMSSSETTCENNTLSLSFDRSGKEIITPTNPGLGFVAQSESITFEISTLNGNKEKRKL